MGHPLNYAFLAHRRSWLRRWPRLQILLRELYLRHMAWAIRLDDEMILCRILGRYKLYADPSDRSISPHLIMQGYWEPRTTEVIIDLMRHGMTAIDVGANLGYFTIVMAAVGGTPGRVLAFEPNPGTAKRLRESLLLNGFQTRVDLHEVVLGATDGEEVNLLLSVNHPGGTQVTSLTPDGPSFIKARTRRLDGVPGALDAALVKIDAEGMEEEIWRGMTAMIAGDRLRNVIVEFTPSSYKNAPAMLDEAEAAGFRISSIDDERGICSISRSDILHGAAQQMLIFQR